jgi:hypothetical protein
MRGKPQVREIHSPVFRAATNYFICATFDTAGVVFMA